MLRKAGWVGRPCPYPGGRLDLSLLSPVMGDCGKSLQRGREAVVLRYSQGAWRRATLSLTSSLWSYRLALAQPKHL